MGQIRSPRPALLGALALLLLPTVAVVWAGLAFPSPLRILEDGLPNPGRGTGRRARIAGLEFVEFPAGCYRLPHAVVVELLPARLLSPLLPPKRPCVLDPRDELHWEEARRCYRFEVPLRLSTRTVEESDIPALGITTSLPLRSTTQEEEILWCAAAGEPPPTLFCIMEFTFDQSPPHHPRRLAFTLAPGEQRLVGPYLVDGE